MDLLAIYFENSDKDLITSVPSFLGANRDTLSPEEIEAIEGLEYGDVIAFGGGAAPRVRVIKHLELEIDGLLGYTACQVMVNGIPAFVAVDRGEEGMTYEPIGDEVTGEPGTTLLRQAQAWAGSLPPVKVGGGEAGQERQLSLVDVIRALVASGSWQSSWRAGRALDQIRSCAPVREQTVMYCFRVEGLCCPRLAGHTDPADEAWEVFETRDLYPTGGEAILVRTGHTKQCIEAEEEAIVKAVLLVEWLRDEREWQGFDAVLWLDRSWLERESRQSERVYRWELV